MRLTSSSSSLAQGNLDELRRLADQGNTTASEVLRDLED
jgi:hypothetical protein